MKLYMAVTNDEYELPVAVADSKTELANMTGISRKNQEWIKQRMIIAGDRFRGKYLMREVIDDD